MTHRSFSTFAVAVLTMIGLTVSLAGAQTTANGPYYATPSWDQTLPSSTRFIILSNFANSAVLDRETGVVWERSPDTTEFTWHFARGACADKAIGGRKGWRLPSVVELASLADPSIAFPALALPAGHPFQNVTQNLYWSATTFPDPVRSAAWGVAFQQGGIVTVADKPADFPVWCARGGMTADQY
jgi:hypothetical protein